MSCPIEIERKVLYVVENAAKASLGKEKRRENYSFRQKKTMRISLCYKCTNLNLDAVDCIHCCYIHF